MARAAATSGRSCWRRLSFFATQRRKSPSVERSPRSPRRPARQSSSMVMSQFSIRSPNAIAMGSQFRFLPDHSALIVPRCFQRCFTTKRCSHRLLRRHARGPRFNQGAFRQDLEGGSCHPCRWPPLTLAFRRGDTPGLQARCRRAPHCDYEGRTRRDQIPGIQHSLGANAIAQLGVTQNDSILSRYWDC